MSPLINGKSQYHTPNQSFLLGFSYLLTANISTQADITIADIFIKFSHSSPILLTTTHAFS